MPLPLPSSGSGDADRRTPLPPPPNAPGGSEPAASSGQVCYRHPDREVGRRCTRCGRPACGECLRQASVGSNCLDCVKAAKPDMATRAKYWQAKQPAFVAYALIAANLVVFVYTLVAHGIAGLATGSNETARQFGLNKLFIDGVSARYDNVLGAPLTVSGDEFYRLVTSGFIHFGLIHLAFNMYFLYILGNLVEPQIGRVRFGLVYAASLLGGSAGVVVIDGGISGGASGAVFGLMGAVAVGYWQSGINPFSTQLGRILLINVALTFFVGFISIGGHLGGLAAGAICGLVTMAPGYKGFPRWATYATPVAVGVVSVVLAIVVARS